MLGLAAKTFAAAFAVSLLSAASAVSLTSATGTSTHLNVEAAKSGRMFGTYLDPHGLASQSYREDLHDFSLIEAWSSWSQLEPCGGCWNWSTLDNSMSTIGSTGAVAKSAALLWGHEPGGPGSLTPPYLSLMDATQLRAELKQHIQTVVKRYPLVRVWTVANEPFQNPNAYQYVGMYSNVFRRTLGPGWVREALVDAYEANPSATYVAINEINADGVNFKSTKMYDYYRTRLVGAIPASHLAVGLQMHLDSCPSVHLNPGAWDIASNMDRFALLGVQVHITEMDFVARCAAPTQAQQLEAQASKYHDVTLFCVAISMCRSMSVWGIGDADSWYRWQRLTTESPLLLDDVYMPKPAYFGVVAALNHR